MAALAIVGVVSLAGLLVLAGYLIGRARGTWD